MRTQTRYCDSCGDNTEHSLLGFIPRYLITRVEPSGLSSDNNWVKAAMCNECGSISRLHIKEEEYRRAEERYIKTLYEHGLIDEKEASELLG